MGLDTIELVLQLEKDFSIDIPDKDAQNLVCVRDLANYIAERTKGSDHESNYETVESRITKLLIQEFDVSPKIIRPSSRFVEDLGLE